MGKYQVAILGGGPGGYEAALRAAKLGMKTVLVEQDRLGGTCLNRGCVPTKALLQSAEVFHAAKKAATFGVGAGDVRFDYEKISARKDKIVTKMVRGVEFLMQNNGVEVLNTRGTLSPEGKILVEGQALEADNVILATGSSPATLPIEGADLPGVLNSDQVLGLTHCPASVVIVGGGVIGVEFATLFGTLGAGVTVLEMLPTIMGPAMDADISGQMLKELKKRKISVKLGAAVDRIEPGMAVHYTVNGQPQVAQGEIVIMAVGRKPNTTGLGLGEAGVEVTERGFVPIDEYARTNRPGIYAIGDITGKIQLAHAATAQGMTAVHHIAGQNRPLDYSLVPSCVYTDPEVACVGLTESAAIEAGHEVRVGSFPMVANARSQVLDRSGGFVKVVTEAGSGKILGAQMMCPHATDMIASISLAMAGGIDVDRASLAVFPHPTVSEAIGEALHDVHGLSNNKD